MQSIPLTFDSNYWELYPCHADVAVEGFDPIPEGVGVQLRLRSDMQGFDHFLYATNESPFRRTSGDEIVVRFKDDHEPEPQMTSTTLKAVGRDGQESHPCSIQINYYPREHYAASGKTLNGWVMVQRTDLFLTSTNVEDYVLDTPDPEETAFVRERWGGLQAGGTSDHETACALGRAIIADLEDHRGVPSDVMDGLSPIGQYRRTVAGDDHVWCGNYAAIFSAACNALGIPARRISMHRDADNQPPEGSDYVIRIATGHGTTEIFDRQRNQWIWMDVMFSMLGAYLGEEGPLNLAEMHRFVNDPARAGRLRVIYHDPITKEERRESLDECKRGSSCYNSFKRDQTFTYFKATR